MGALSLSKHGSLTWGPALRHVPVSRAIRWRSRPLAPPVCAEGNADCTGEGGSLRDQVRIITALISHDSALYLILSANGHNAAANVSKRWCLGLWSLLCGLRRRKSV